MCEDSKGDENGTSRNLTERALGHSLVRKRSGSHSDPKVGLWGNKASRWTSESVSQNEFTRGSESRVHPLRSLNMFSSEGVVQVLLGLTDLEQGRGETGCRVVEAARPNCWPKQ